MHAADAGVGDQQGLAAVVDLDGVEEALAVDVREVHADALLVESAHEVPAEAREPAAPTAGSGSAGDADAAAGSPDPETGMAEAKKKITWWDLILLKKQLLQQ